MSKKQKYENYVNSLSEKEAKKELLELFMCMKNHKLMKILIIKDMLKIY